MIFLRLTLIFTNMITGLCTLCNKAGVLYTCSFCGRLVCAEHYDFTKSLCVVCSGGKKFYERFGFRY